MMPVPGRKCVRAFVRAGSKYLPEAEVLLRSLLAIQTAILLLQVFYRLAWH